MELYYIDYETKIYPCTCHDCALMVDTFEVGGIKEVEFTFMKTTNNEYKEGWLKRVKSIIKYLRTGKLEGPVVSLTCEKAEELNKQLQQFIECKVTTVK